MTLDREIWSLVEVDGERRVLFEAYDNQRPSSAQPVTQRLMTIREALREPRSVARKIWLALED